MSSVIYLKSEEKLQSTLKQELSAVFAKGDKIAVKLHFGEPGNNTSLKPEFVKKIVDVLKEMGTIPFLFDSLVMYNSPRSSVEGHLKAAEQQGYSLATMGCPIVISDEFMDVKGKAMTYQVCKTLTSADGVLILSHLKGHFCSGFGGAIKNLGMGALTKKTKADIHKGGEPTYLAGCTLCKACEKSCSLDNIRYADNRPYFDKSWCCGCSDCVYACKFKALKTKSDYGFDYLLSEGADAAYKHFKKSYCVTDARRITKNCDCFSDPGKPIATDLGILMSKDIVAIEQASMDLINKAAGEDFFLKMLKKSPSVHIKEAEKLGMGRAEYKLERIN